MAHQILQQVLEYILQHPVGAFFKDYYCIRSLETFLVVLTILASYMGHSNLTA